MKYSIKTDVTYGVFGIIYFVKYNIYFIISIFLTFIEFFIVIFTIFMVLYRQDKKGLHDILTKTKVIKI